MFPAIGSPYVARNVGDLLVSGAHPCVPAPEVCPVASVVFMFGSYTRNGRPSRCNLISQTRNPQPRRHAQAQFGCEATPKAYAACLGVQPSASKRSFA